MVARAVVHARKAWILAEGEDRGQRWTYVRVYGRDDLKFAEEIRAIATRASQNHVYIVSKNQFLIHDDAMRFAPVHTVIRAHPREITDCLRCAGLEECPQIKRNMKLFDRIGVLPAIRKEDGTMGWQGFRPMGGPQGSTGPNGSTGANTPPRSYTDRMREALGPAIFGAAAAFVFKEAFESAREAPRPNTAPAAGWSPWANEAPPPEVASALRTLGRPVLSTDAARAEATVREAHKRLISANHPDRGGDAAKAAEINAARDKVLEWIAARPAQR